MGKKNCKTFIRVYIRNCKQILKKSKEIVKFIEVYIKKIRGIYIRNCKKIRSEPGRVPRVAGRWNRLWVQGKTRSITKVTPSNSISKSLFDFIFVPECKLLFKLWDAFIIYFLNIPLINTNNLSWNMKN